MQIGGFSHVSLTVPDLVRSEEWYSRVLGLVRVLEQPDDGTGHQWVYLVHPTTYIGIGLHTHATTNERFSETTTGLDHVSFSVPSRESLDEWASRLDDLGVQHSPVVDVSYGGVLVFRDPDNIQLELIYIPPEVQSSIAQALTPAHRE